MDFFKNIRTIVALLFVMLAVAVAWSLTGCTRTVKSVEEKTDTTYIAVHHTDTLIRESQKRDTIYIARMDSSRRAAVSRDSVLIRDSVFVKEKGDTVYVYKERTRERVSIARDTVSVVKHDTVLMAHTDTVRVLRYVERSDTTSHTAKNDTKVEMTKSKKKVFLFCFFGGILISGFLVWVVSRFSGRK